MNLINLRRLLTVAILLLPVPALAIPAITCHCFTDRSYDPARPAVADPYFLASTQNSFFAAIFNVDKKGVVMKKQKGISSDDLWVAYSVSSLSGVLPERLLETKESKGTWKGAVLALGIKTDTLGKEMAAALQAGSAAPRLADVVVNETILRHRLLDGGELSALRKAGATNQEVFLAVLVAPRLKQPARQVHASVRSGTKSWGKALAEAGVEPSEIQTAVAALVRSSR